MRKQYLQSPSDFSSMLKAFKNQFPEIAAKVAFATGGVSIGGHSGNISVCNFVCITNSDSWYYEEYQQKATGIFEKILSF